MTSKSVKPMWVLSCVSALALVGHTATAETGQPASPGDTFIAYGTEPGGQIELSFDAEEFSRQGWSLSQEDLTLPVLTGGEQSIRVVTQNGDYLQLGGTPRVAGGLELISPDGQRVSVTDFSIPFSGRFSAMLETSQHPIFEIVGDSLEISFNDTELVLTGLIGLHAAAVEVGLDPSVGVVGAFSFFAPMNVLDVDQTVAPAREVSTPNGPANPELPGADVTVGSLPNLTHWTAGGAVNGMHAYSVATTSCNIGTQPLDWFQGPNTRHPVIAQNMYRLRGGRMEQIGQSWLKHGFCALQQSLCQSCTPVGACCCSQLGVGCSDPYSSSRNGSFNNMGPKSEINAHMGTNLGNHAFPQGNAQLRGRIQVHVEDLDPDLNPGALYFVEGQYVAEDDAQFGDQTNDNNNASYRAIAINPNTFAATTIGSTIREKAAIHAWEANDPQVSIKNMDVEGEGRFILASRVTDLGDGTWHYEYAVMNLNSDLSGRSFTLETFGGVSVSNVGFHDVDYHSGEPYDSTDWAFTSDGTNLTWATDAFAESENANALRWGTMYNFRFDSAGAPTPGFATVGLFKPSDVSSVTATTLVPSASCAPAGFAPAAAGVPFSSRAYDGYVDSRRESADGSTVIGLSSLTVEFTTAMENADGSALSAAAFSIADTGGSAPSITGISTDDGRVVTIELDGHISLQEWTTLSVNARSLCAQEAFSGSIDIGYLPADVDQNGVVNPLDLLKFKQYVNGVGTPPVGTLVDFADMDRSGTVNPLDLLSLKRLINGIAPSTQEWAGASLPTQP